VRERRLRLRPLPRKRVSVALTHSLAHRARRDGAAHAPGGGDEPRITYQMGERSTAARTDGTPGAWGSMRRSLHAHPFDEERAPMWLEIVSRDETHSVAGPTRVDLSQRVLESRRSGVKIAGWSAPACSHIECLRAEALHRAVPPQPTAALPDSAAVVAGSSLAGPDRTPHDLDPADPISPFAESFELPGLDSNQQPSG
jgi:hypothetical protein